MSKQWSDVSDPSIAFQKRPGLKHGHGNTGRRNSNAKAPQNQNLILNQPISRPDSTGWIKEVTK